MFGHDRQAIGSGTLPSAVPQIQSQIAHESGMTMFNVDSGTQSSNIFGDIVAEDDGAHGRFPGTRFAHKQDLLLAFATVHDEGFARSCRADPLCRVAFD